MSDGVTRIVGWRVVLDDGACRAVEMRALDGEFWASLRPGGTSSCEPTPRIAIARLASAMSLDVAEILAPGQPSHAEAAVSAFALGVEASARECEKMAATVRGERVVYGNGAPSEDVAIALDSVAAVIRDIAATKPEPSSADVLEAIRAGRIKCESCGNVATGGHIACGRCAD